MRIRISSPAFADLERAYWFYEAQRAGLGEYFQNSLFSNIESLRDCAGIHQKIYGYYRSLTRPFPFAIFYYIAGDVIVVAHVFDLRRDPESLRRRLSP